MSYSALVQPSLQSLSLHPSPNPAPWPSAGHNTTIRGTIFDSHQLNRNTLTTLSIMDVKMDATLLIPDIIRSVPTLRHLKLHRIMNGYQQVLALDRLSQLETLSLSVHVDLRAEPELEASFFMNLPRLAPVLTELHITCTSTLVPVLKYLKPLFQLRELRLRQFHSGMVRYYLDHILASHRMLQSLIISDASNRQYPSAHLLMTLSPALPSSTTATTPMSSSVITAATATTATTTTSSAAAVGGEEKRMMSAAASTTKGSALRTIRIISAQSPTRCIKMASLVSSLLSLPSSSPSVSNGTGAATAAATGTGSVSTNNNDVLQFNVSYSWPYLSQCMMHNDGANIISMLASTGMMSRMKSVHYPRHLLVTESLTKPWLDHNVAIIP